MIGCYHDAFFPAAKSIARVELSHNLQIGQICAAWNVVDRRRNWQLSAPV